MPEGPEVYSFGIEAYKYFNNNILKKVKILSGKYKRKPFKNYFLLSSILPSKILSISTYGKILLIELEMNYFLVVTFGLTGFITPNNIAHNHIEFITSKSSNLYFNDQRNFGNIYLLTSDTLLEKLKVLGPDLLDDRTTFSIFCDRFNIYKQKNPNKEIGLILLDQSFVSGIGNYLRADILYYSKMSPYRKLSKITTNELKNLYNNAYNLIRYYASIQINTNDMIKSNLSYRLDLTPKDYGRVFMIYGESKDIYGNIVSKDKFYGRSIYWVGKIQK